MPSEFYTTPESYPLVGFKFQEKFFFMSCGYRWAQACCVKILGRFSSCLVYALMDYGASHVVKFLTIFIFRAHQRYSLHHVNSFSHLLRIIKRTSRPAQNRGTMPRPCCLGFRIISDSGIIGIPEDKLPII